MIISVNGESITYTLEGERNAGDIVAGLRSWLESSGMLISSLRIDGREYNLADDLWGETPIEGMHTLDVSSVSRREARIRQLGTVRDYFRLLADASAAGDGQTLMELSESWSDLTGMLPNLLGDGWTWHGMDGLTRKMEQGGFPLDGSVLLSDSAPVAAEASSMAALMDGRLKEATEPLAGAQEAAEKLADAAESLDDVAVNLQIGKDRQAMDTIIHMTDLLQALMRCASWLGGEEMADITKDLTGILAELEEGLKAGDSVLIGDLLEYEIKPRLKELPAGLRSAAGSQS